MIAYIIHYTSISLQVFSCSLHVHFQLNAHALLCHKISQLLQLHDSHSHSVITKFQVLRRAGTKFLTLCLFQLQLWVV